MPRLLLAVLLCFLTLACGGPRYVDYFPYHDDGRPKPQVVLLPVVDCTRKNLPWDLSCEITNGLRDEVRNRGVLFLFSEEQAQEWLTQSKVDFFTNEETLAKVFCGADFIVLTEFLEHEYIPYHPPGIEYSSLPPQTLLSVKVRLKIIDLHLRYPRVVLQEVITRCFTNPCAPCSDLTSDAYAIAVVQKAHQQFLVSLTERIQEVICSSY